jgi:tetratricopeptide (TPR) repeat protein
MSIQQLRSFLDDGERSVAAAHKSEHKPGDPLALLAAGDAAAMDKKYADAARLYGEALAKAPKNWGRRGPALVSRIRALQKLPDPGACVDLALAEMKSTGDAAAAGDFLAFALDCVDALPKTDPRVEKLRVAALPRLTALANNAAAPLSADDRGDVWRMVWDVKEKLDDPAGARAAAEQRLAVLDAAAAKAPDAWAASTYDGARMETYLYLGNPDAAIDFLAKSEAALPTDYNPPARLARAYLEGGRFGEALAAVDRALAKAYGPRKAQIFRLKADILEKQGRLDDAAKVVGEEIALWQSLPEGQRRPASIEAARKRLESLRTTAQKKP